MENILIRDTLILPMTEQAGGRCFRGHIGIADGEIAFVSEDDGVADEFVATHTANCRTIDGRGRLAMPGLVNTHSHIPMTLLRGYADDLPLMTWLADHVWPFEARMTRDDIRVGAQLGMAEMLLGGTTTALDMYWMDEAVGEAADCAGIRAVVASSILDGKRADFDADFAMLAERYGGGRHRRIIPMVAPHAVYTCSPETLEYARDVAAAHGVGITVHVSETLDEQQFVRERYGCTPVEMLSRLGLLSERTLAVHCVYVSDDDIEIMRKAGVSVSHNPQSNMKLASGIAPFARMAAAGLNVAIGTDGPASNNDLDMWEEMRAASFLQKVATLDPCAFPAHDVLRMATVGGAHALGLGDRIGQLRAGMAADVILLDIEKPHLYPCADMVANLVYCGKASDVDTVIVDGRVVVEGRRLLTLDISDLCREAQQRFQTIRNLM
ncbi:MAG: amidohydrolase [Rikenellaceae bacterium]|nr:amidohydrolase [Rikenellaceae bacterium]MCL2692085.1 amidohydrolase [Rikenellaceae bacterium]